MSGRPTARQSAAAGRVALVAVAVAVIVVAPQRRAHACSIDPDPPPTPVEMTDIVAVVVPVDARDLIEPGFMPVSGPDQIWTVVVVEVEHGPSGLTTMEVVDPSCGGSITHTGGEQRLLLRFHEGEWWNWSSRIGPPPVQPWQDPASVMGAVGGTGSSAPIIGSATAVASAVIASVWVVRRRRLRSRPA